MLSVLGIDVSPDLLDRWTCCLAPAEQPFFVTKKQAASWELPIDDDRQPTAEQRSRSAPAGCCTSPRSRG